MSHLNKEDIIKLKTLAKIDLTPEEEDLFLNDLNNILTHVSQVSNFDSSDTTTTLRFDSQVRPDIKEEFTFNRDTMLANIPQKSKDNFVKVSKVIKK